jgi:apolipoprotein D and lipocalin family protein
MLKPKKSFFLVYLTFFLGACTSIPEGIEPVTDFELEPYLGKWYEIARLDHSFEKGMQQVSATYYLRADGGVRVLNEGYVTESEQWEQAEGKAYFVAEEDLAHLKVSFFGPFYASYIVFELGENYDYAFVTSNNKSYLWLLARTPEISESLKDRFISRANSLGYNLDELIWVEH